MIRLCRACINPFADACMLCSLTPRTPARGMALATMMVWPLALVMLQAGKQAER